MIRPRVGARLIAIAALVVAAGGAAQAADMPLRKAPLAPPPIAFSWSGFYLGANAGYVWARDDVLWEAPVGGSIAPAIGIAATGPIDARGFTAGGQLGYNFQFNWLVVGFEADLNYTDLSGSRFSVPVGFTNAMFSSFESRWLSTVRGRIGVAFDRVLLYGTGGLAVADVKVYDQIGIGILFTNSSDEARAGWTAGGGIEWAFAPAWSVKGEYLHVDLGTVNHNDLCAGVVCTAGVPLHHRIREDVARIGVNYRFTSQ
jgi:outer membrane immunogenic protein